MIDISVPLGPLTPAWPGSAGIRLTRTKTLAAGDDSNSSRLDCDVHAGTHVDAPAHFLADGAEVDTLRLDVLVGPAFVASLPEAQSVSAVDLAGLQPPSRYIPPSLENQELRAVVGTPRRVPDGLRGADRRRSAVAGGPSCPACRSGLPLRAEIRGQSADTPGAACRRSRDRRRSRPLPRCAGAI